MSIYNERGLRTDTTYVFNDDGSVNWKKMIPSEFLATKHEYKDALTKQYGDLSLVDPTTLDDKYLLILLGGIKRLLSLRGYRSLVRKVDLASPERCVVTCTIEFAPNYETDMVAVTYSDVASASLYNTSGDINQQFLECTAANRALVRCVRGFLNVNVVGKDEIGPKPSGGAPVTASNQEVESAPTGFHPKDTLAKKCHEQGLSFDQIKKAAIKVRAELKSDPEVWTAFEDVPSLDCYTLLNKLTKPKK